MIEWGETIFEIDVPDDAAITGSIAVGSYVALTPEIGHQGILVEIATSDREPLWGYWFPVFDGEIILDDALPGFLREELEGEIRV